MKKKSILISFIAVIVVFLMAWGITCPKPLGSMRHIYTKPTTSTSVVSFTGEKDDSIKISFRADIKSGDLDIIVYDSKGRSVYELDRAKELETFFTPENSDTYRLSAEYSDFIGSFKVEVY